MTLHVPTETVVEVDPDRLESGRWCHRVNRMIGQGDISASYSADRIGMGQSVRKPFTWKGALWVCVAKRPSESGAISTEAYRLTPEALFDGAPVTYAAKTAGGGDAARADPNGFYHAMSVRHGRECYVLTGPPIQFLPGQTEQLTLF